MRCRLSVYACLILYILLMFAFHRYLVVFYTAIRLFFQYGYQFSYIRTVLKAIYPVKNKYVTLEDIGLVAYDSKHATFFIIA